MAGPVLIADAEVIGIPVKVCGEPLVDVTRIPRLRVDDRKTDPYGAFRCRARTWPVGRSGWPRRSTLSPWGLAGGW